MRLLAALTVIAACSKPAPEQQPPPPEPPGPEPAAWSDAWINREAKRFVEDVAYRRAALESSLVNHANTYSAQRLGSYALGDRGWDALPAWNPRSLPVTKEIAAQLERGEFPLVPETADVLWDGKVPTTRAEWIALGRKVFFEYPMRSEVFMEWGLTKPALADAIGVDRLADGSIPGLVLFANIDGSHRVGITCAICHSA